MRIDGEKPVNPATPAEDRGQKQCSTSSSGYLDQFEELFQNAPVAIYEIDFQGPRFKNVNEAMCRMSGFSREELLGLNPFSMLTPSSAKLFKERINAALAGDKIRESVEYQGIMKGGRMIDFVLNIKPINRDGRFVGALVAGYDITERKKAEEALKESEQLYKTIFDNSDDGFVLVEPIYNENGIACDLRFLQINLAYEKQTGTEAVKVEGRRAKEIAPNLEQEWISLSGEVAKTGKLRRIEDFNQRTKKWYDAQYIPFTKGRVGILFRNVTERKNLEKQLQDKERLAGIGATAGMVGHDIRNPLQAILSDTYLLKTELTSMPECETKEGVAESLDGIENNVNYINKIVQDLQDYARPLTPSAKETDLEKIFEEVLVNKAVPKRVKVTSKVEADAKNLTVDPDLLKRVLTNLVNNAVQAMPKEGKLTINGYKDVESAIITVEDTGLGVAEEIKPKLFTPLFTTKSKGQGFGLAVVKRMTEAMGGTVAFESEVGKGTKFTVRLPVNAHSGDHQSLKHEE